MFLSVRISQFFRYIDYLKLSEALCILDGFGVIYR